jgi:hypothetical protein
MASINEIGIQQINNLDALQLSKLLHRLIEIEVEKNYIVNWDRLVPFNITTGDAGSDGRISWSNGPAETEWLKNRFTIFQNKATTLTPKNCFEELLEPQINKSLFRQLKGEIEKLVKAKGCYVLFTTQSLNDKQKQERIKKFREAIKAANHKNYDTFQILIYDANTIKDWVNQNIAAVTQVQQFNGISRPQAMMLWDEWERHSLSNQNQFQTNELINTNLDLILQTIRTQKVLRVVGHSGLGKTRLVLEAFRHDNLKHSLVYFDMAGIDDIREIKNFIISHQDNQEGIIVFDNCEIKFHEILSALVTGNGKLKIVTIGLDDNQSVEDAKLKVDRNRQRDVVRKIIQNKISNTHSPSDIEHIDKLSEGYPWMAIKFCDAVIRKGFSELSSYPLDDFIRKLLFGARPEDEIEYNIIRSCAVFSAFGFPDDSFRDVINPDLRRSLKRQSEFIRTRIYDGLITETKFRETINKFTKEDIIERKGTFLIIRPTILAINLAANWLINTDHDRIIGIIKELKNVDLDQKFVERFRELDQIDKAKEIVAELWGPNSPFGTAEVLNTSWGSQLFRYVVEVNPTVTVDAIYQAFEKASKDALKKSREGRRNLVWALEKLCFRKETFEKASKVLYSFAAAENENWANNSTNQFMHLFQIHLPGTEASLGKRLSIIRWGLEKEDSDYTRIAIGALSNGLRYDNFHRSGGPERQGSGPVLKDYIPETWQEIFDYWHESIKILTELSCMDDVNSDLAAQAIIESTRTLTKHGQHDAIINSIKKIVQYKNTVWLGAVNNLKLTLGYETHLMPDVVTRIRSLITELTPVDIENQILLKVSKPEWDLHETGEDGHFIDKPKINAEAFAEELYAKKIDWFDYIEKLLFGEQKQAFNFGKRVSELYKDEGLITISISRLERIEKALQNPEFIAGLLVGIGEKNIQAKFLRNLIKNDSVNHHAFYLTRAISPNLADIEILFYLIDEKAVSIAQFENFKYGRVLDNLSKEEIRTLCERISNYGSSGAWTALSLLFMFDLNKQENWESNKDLVQKIIVNQNIFLSSFDRGTMDFYYLAEFVKNILNESPDSTFALVITKQIIDFLSKESFGGYNESYLASILELVFQKWFKDAWPFIGDAIISDTLSYFRLKQVIGSSNGWYESVGILFAQKENFETIINWCRKHPDVAPKRIANMMPLAIEIDGNLGWHPFAKSVIDEFGYNNDVLAELSANMGTFGFTGSVVPYYTSQKILIAQLLNHPIEHVRDWAESKLKYLDTTIRREKLDDEEWSLK